MSAIGGLLPTGVLSAMSCVLAIGWLSCVFASAGLASRGSNASGSPGRPRVFEVMSKGLERF